MRSSRSAPPPGAGSGASQGSAGRPAPRSRKSRGASRGSTLGRAREEGQGRGIALGRPERHLLAVAHHEELDHGVGRQAVERLEVGRRLSIDEKRLDPVAFLQAHGLGEAAERDVNHDRPPHLARSEAGTKRRQNVHPAQAPEPDSLVGRAGHEPLAVGRRGQRVDRAVVPGQEPRPDAIVEPIQGHPRLAGDGRQRARVPGLRRRRDEAVGPPAAVEQAVEGQAVAPVLSVEHVDRVRIDRPEGPAVPGGQGAASSARAKGLSRFS